LSFSLIFINLVLVYCKVLNNKNDL
jgi:hypothetical protein